jgi:hypothetical protein
MAIANSTCGRLSAATSCLKLEASLREDAGIQS